MKSLRSSSPQSNCVTTSSAPSRRNWVFSKSIGSEGAIDAFLAHEFIVTHDSCHALLRKRLGMQHTHLKLPCFLPKENGRFFYWFCHVPPRFRSRVQRPLQKTRVSYQKSAPKVKRTRELALPPRASPATPASGGTTRYGKAEPRNSVQKIRLLRSDLNSIIF